MMPDTQRHHVRTLGSLLHVAGLGCLLLGGTVYYLTVFVPRSRAIERLTADIGKVQQLLRGAGQVRQKYALLVQQREQQRQLADEVRHRIPDEPRAAEFLQAISSASDTRDFLIGDYTRGPVTEADGCWQLDIHLQCSGTYEGICEFLSQLDAMPRITRVVTLELKSQAVEQRYPLNITVRLYFGAQVADADTNNTVMDSNRREARRG